MALDFYNLNDKKHKELLFQINTNELDLIRDALNKFKKLTGIEIDPYGDTRIYAEHALLLAGLIKDSLDNQNVDDEQVNQIYKNFTGVSDGFIAIGD